MSGVGEDEGGEASSFSDPYTDLAIKRVPNKLQRPFECHVLGSCCVKCESDWLRLRQVSVNWRWHYWSPIPWPELSRRLWKCTTSTNHWGARGKEFTTDGTSSIKPGDRRKVRGGEHNLLWKLAMDRSPVWHANEKHTDEGQSACRRAETQKRKQKKAGSTQQCHANKSNQKIYMSFFWVNDQLFSCRKAN